MTVLKVLAGLFVLIAMTSAALMHADVSQFDILGVRLGDTPERVAEQFRHGRHILELTPAPCVDHVIERERTRQVEDQIHLQKPSCVVRALWSERLSRSTR